MINWFKKESKVLRKKITTKVLVIVVAVIVVAVSGTVLMADWTGNTNDVSTMGKVGIGTTSPMYKLQIRQTDAMNSLEISPTTNTNAAGVLVQNSGNRLYLFVDDYAGSYGGSVGGTPYSANIWAYGYKTMNFATNNSVKMVIDGNGNVGIGTNTPQYKLEVNGNTNINGTHMSTNYRCSSDIRYKKDISLFPNALEKVLGLRGVNYFWKTDEYKDKNFSKNKQIGFVAQEVEKVIPELVYTDDKGFKTMSYDRLTAVLVEAVKELNAKSDAKISALEKENAELKKQVASLNKLNERMTMLEKAIERNKFAAK